MFEILAQHPTSMGGDLVLRRRMIPTIQTEVYEVILGDEHLMSSLFTTAEIALADLGLAAVSCAEPLDVVVGGLGLGYTAAAAVHDPRVGSLHVVEALPEVISWHEDGLLPMSPPLDDPRCHFVRDSFFGAMAGGRRFGDAPEQLHAVLLDIDHTPRHLLDPSHAFFYEPDGLRLLHDRLHPGGVFALWSDVVPDERYLADLESVFGNGTVHEATFANPHTGGEAMNAVVVATRR